MQKTSIPSLLILAQIIFASAGSVSSAMAQTAAATRGVEDISQAASSTIQIGPYYALVIGNNNYQYLPKLQTAVFDAKSVAQALEQNYGFKVKLLPDATRNDILSALNEYRRTLSDKANLLIYYAGHGNEDPDNHEAYWLPVDAQADNNVNWISADDITSDLRAIPALHVLIISDSCYSGALSATRGSEVAITPRERAAYLAKVLSSKSRNLMASGGKEPVSDGGAGGHSVFAGALLEGLSDIKDEEFTAADLFQEFLPAVAGRSQQTPHYSLISNSGHEYGDFVFARTTTVATTDSGSIKLAPPSVLVVPEAPRNPEAEAIRAVLHRYHDAYESESVSELLLVWPSLSGSQKNALNRLFGKIHAIRVELQCDDPSIQGPAAKVKCSQTMRYTADGKIQPSQENTVEVSLSKSDRGWLVDNVKAQ